jgi:hypothetical protein
VVLGSLSLSVSLCGHSIPPGPFFGLFWGRWHRARSHPDVARALIRLVLDTSRVALSLSLSPAWVGVGLVETVAQRASYHDWQGTPAVSLSLDASFLRDTDDEFPWHRVKSLVREWDTLTTSPPLSSANSLSPSLHSRASSNSLSSVSSSPRLNDVPESENEAVFATGNAFSPSAGHNRKRSRDLPPLSIPDSPKAASSMQAAQQAAKARVEAESSTFLDSQRSLRPETDSEDQEVFLPLTPNSATSASFNVPPISPNPDSAKVRSLTAAERRDHSRRHSRIHSRNLSVFFPRPDEHIPAQIDEQNYEHEQVPPVVIDTPSTSPVQRWERRASTGFGGGAKPNDIPRPSRRAGHHHRHSMSHKYVISTRLAAITTWLNDWLMLRSFFSFLDPTNAASPISAGSSASGPITSPTTPHSGVPKPVPSTLSLARQSSNLPALPSLYSKYSHLPSPIRFMIGLAHLRLRAQLALLLAATQVAIGAALWVTGQSRESLSVTALGYWVVFDGVAAGCVVAIEGRAGGVEEFWDVLHGRQAAGYRFPFG